VRHAKRTFSLKETCHARPPQPPAAPATLAAAFAALASGTAGGLQARPCE
jgi:hypothetical protein